MTWCLNSLASLHWRCWDEEWAVFDVGSGQTHQMDTMTAVVLMTVEASSVDTSELMLRLADDLLIPHNRELLDTLNGILERLATAGLIESASR